MNSLDIINSLIYSFNATLPVFLVMVIGLVLRHINLLDKPFLTTANRLIFNICLPAMLFVDLVKTDIRSTFDGKLVIYSAIATTIAFVLIWIGAKLFIKDKSIIGAFVQGAYRSSVAILGISFMMNIYGNSGQIPMIIIGSVPLFNIFAVIVLGFEGDNESGEIDPKAKVKSAILGIAKNPIIIGIVVGIIGSLLIYDLPPILDKTLSSVSQIASPLSLLVIGASFEGKKAIAKIKPTVVCSAIKLVVLPLMFLFPAVWLGFRNEALMALIIMLGSPTTPSSYIMAVNMKNDGVLTSSVIATTTLLSAVTLTFWIFLFNFLGYM